MFIGKFIILISAVSLAFAQTSPSSLCGYQSSSGVFPTCLSTIFSGYPRGNSSLAIQGQTSSFTTAYGNFTNGLSAYSVNTIGSNNFSSGYMTLFNNTSGSGNIAILRKAGYWLTTGWGNVFEGMSAGQTVTSGCRNVGIGFESLAGGNSGGLLALTGCDNIAIGGYALQALSGTSVGMIGIGYRACASAYSIYGVCIGYSAAPLSSGVLIAICSNCAPNLTVGNGSVIIGTGAAATPTIAQNLVLIGSNADAGAGALTGLIQLQTGKNSASNTAQAWTINFLDNAGNATFKTVGVYVGSPLSSASTIAPANGLTHVTGTVTISTITVPTVLQNGAAFTGCINLIPDGLWTTTTGGNIALGSTAVVGKVLQECFDGILWYPSY